MSSLEDVEGPLEPVEYLARSPSRLRVLDAIHEESPTRNELKEMTDVSRVTLSRILTDFEDRGWIVRNAGELEATAAGAIAAREVSSLLETMITPYSTDLNASTGDLVDLMREGTADDSYGLTFATEFVGFRGLRVDVWRHLASRGKVAPQRNV